MPIPPHRTAVRTGWVGDDRTACCKPSSLSRCCYSAVVCWTLTLTHSAPHFYLEIRTLVKTVRGLLHFVGTKTIYFMIKRSLGGGGKVGRWVWGPTPVIALLGSRGRRISSSDFHETNTHARTHGGEACWRKPSPL